MTPAFYDRPAEVVARELLGAQVVSEVSGVRCSGRIVETEAYTGPEDEASHAHIRFGRTRRNQAMWGPPGRAYVYRIYGIHWCLNAVTGPEDFPAAVLIRAAEPLQGQPAIHGRRGGSTRRNLLRGPGNLTRGPGIDGSLDHHPLDTTPLWITPGVPVADAGVRRGPRIGITRNAAAPLRFWIGGSPWVSARGS